MSCPRIYTSAEDILARLDQRPAPPQARATIACRILQETNRLDELVNEILAEHRLGFADRSRLAELTERLNRERRNSDPDRDESVYHLAYGVLPVADEELHGYLAEYYYSWASNLGIPEEKVSEIILDVHFRKNID